MENINQIKEELLAFGIKHNACEDFLNSINGNTLTELFANISPYINWCKVSKEKTKEFNSIFDNKLVIEDGTLLCCCTNLESIEIPNSVTYLGNSAFSFCSGLKSIKIPIL